jgi:serine/threonine protein kinase
MEHLQRGYIFEGKYRIQGELGRGGFGMVYLAYQIGMDRNVALKVLKPDLQVEASMTARERFLREVKIISKLRHPNTVTIHDFGETGDGLVYMVLEYVDGETLKDVINRRGAFRDERASKVCIQVAKSLSEAHRHGIIHRDLKPANIMLTELGGEEDFVKVLDFGIARLRGGRDKASEDLTSVGVAPGERQLIGTPRYMSPEQVRGEELTGASDVYSLGLMFYEMLTGEPAVTGNTAMALITQQISPEPLRLGNLNRLHPALQRVVQRAVAKSMQHRYRTVDVMAQELEQALFEIRRESMGFAGMSDASASGDFLLNNNYASNNFGTGPYAQQNPQQQQWNRQSGGFPAAQQMDPMIQGNQTPSGHYVHPSGAYNQAPPAQQMQPAQSYPQQQQGYGQQGYGQQQGGYASGPMPGLQGNTPPGHGQMPGLQGNAPQQPMPGLQGNAAPQHMQGAHASSSGSALLNSADLPPAPSDRSGDSAFAPEPELDQTAIPPYRQTVPEQPYQPTPQEQPRQKTIASARSVDEESSLEFSITLITAIGMTLLLIVIIYVLFLTLGATAELVVDGPIRLMGTAIAAILIPLVPLVAEGGARERFAVVSSGLHKLRKASTVGVAINGMSILLLCIFFSSQIVGELRAAPNWFLNSNDPQNESGFAAFNRKNSYMLADIVEESMLAAGMQKKRASEVKMPEPPKPTRPDTKSDEDTPKVKPRTMPAPTRPGTKSMPKSTRPKTTDKKSPSKDSDKKGGKDDTYIKW